jgi:hypothetical protein
VLLGPAGIGEPKEDANADLATALPFISINFKDIYINFNEQYGLVGLLNHLENCPIKLHLKL